MPEERNVRTGGASISFTSFGGPTLSGNSNGIYVLAGKTSSTGGVIGTATYGGSALNATINSNNTISVSPGSYTNRISLSCNLNVGAHIFGTFIDEVIFGPDSSNTGILRRRLLM